MLGPVATLLTLLAPADSILLRVLTINDLHGALDPRPYSWSRGRPIGGVAALKSAMDSAEVRCRCPVLRVDAGDEMQGSLLSNLAFGRSTIAALNRIGLHAAAVGNHDLDWSVDTLRARMRDARYPWLVANVFDSVSRRRPQWAVPWRMLEAGGFRVAVIGFITGSTKAIVAVRNTVGLEFREGASGFHDVLAEVRSQRPDLTILVAHAGAHCDSDTCTGEIMDLAAQLDSTAVQLIVAGHSHTQVNAVVNGIPIVEAWSYGQALGIADLVAGADGGRRFRVRIDTLWADAVTPDASMDRVLAPYRPAADSLAGRRIAVLRDSLPRDLKVDQYPLGNLLADAWRVMARAEVGLMNNGGIRVDLPAGPVTYGQLFELQPFANQLVRMKTTGAVLRAALEERLRGKTPRLHVSGLKVIYDPGRAPGSRIVALRLANGRSVRDSTGYSVGLLDFLANGGDGLTMFADQPRTQMGMTDLEALIAYLRRQPQPVATPRGRRVIARVGSAP